MARLRTSNCYKSASYHKVRYYKKIKEMADDGNLEAMYLMIKMAENYSQQQYLEEGEKNATST